MSFLGKIFASSAAQPIEAVGNLLDKLFTSDDEKLDKKIIMQRLIQEPGIAQVELNKVEAQHRSTFVAGARPFMMWVCGVGFAFIFIINPIIQWVTGEAGPPMPTDVIFELAMGMLGMSGLRTVEKLTGRAK